MKLIIAYKLLKALLVGLLAAWITWRREEAAQAIASLATALADAHSFWSHAGAWIAARSSGDFLSKAELVLWLDAVSTGIEGGLLWYGRPWAQWVVVLSLALLVPLELLSLEQRPSMIKVAVLGINVAVVAYLVAVRLRSR